MKLASGVCLLLAALVAGANAGGPTLVLLDNLAIKETHSIFFKTLQGWYILSETYGFLEIIVTVFGEGFWGL